MSRRRAVVLLLVHVLVAVHVAHYVTTGRTVSPLEPSEAMEFSKHGIINAGLVFLALSALSTLVLGRWFCGWGCHLVAVQDLSRWILIKLGLRPQPLRSRALLWVPLIAALYMFVYPFAYRLWMHGDVTAHQVALTTTDFWRTFPPWPVAVFSIGVSGSILIWFFGAKGFCTYACPYGAIYGLADKLAVGSIRVTDACAGCMKCTAVCSSNVRVHAEVDAYGMVVNPGCMKTLDCVNSCPQNALYYGFGKPSILARPRKAPKGARGSRFSWPEELALALLFVGLFFAVRGLYGVMAFLVSLAVAGILALLGITAARLFYRRSLSLGRRRLKHAGRLTAGGWGFVALVLLAAAGVAHAGLIQYHSKRGAAELEELRGPADRALAGETVDLDDREERLLDSALEHAGFVREHGWLSTARNRIELAWLSLIDGRPGDFVEHMRAASGQSQAGLSPHRDLARFYEARGLFDEAIVEYEALVAGEPDAVEIDRLARLLWRVGRTDDSVEVYRTGARAHPGNSDLHFNLGVALAMLERLDEGIEAFQRVVELDPARLEARENLAGLLCGSGRAREGLEQYRLILAERPGDLATIGSMVQAYRLLGDLDGAREELGRELAERPGRPELEALLESLGPPSDAPPSR